MVAREMSCCSCLTVLPGPAWVLLSKTYKPLFAPLYSSLVWRWRIYQMLQAPWGTRVSGSRPRGGEDKQAERKRKGAKSDLHSWLCLFNTVVVVVLIDVGLGKGEAERERRDGIQRVRDRERRIKRAVAPTMARINQTEREREGHGPWPSHYSRRDDAAERDSHKLFAIKISAEQELFPLLATGISEVIKTRSVQGMCS